MDGPLQVVGDSGAGALRSDLHDAWLAALRIRRSHARERALAFGWKAVADLFVSYLAVQAPAAGAGLPRAVRDGAALPVVKVPALSHKRHWGVEQSSHATAG